MSCDSQSGAGLKRFRQESRQEKRELHKLKGVLIGSWIDKCVNDSPGSYWSSSHWRSAYKSEIIGGQPPIYGDFENGLRWITAYQ